MNRKFANYHTERTAFSHLFGSGCDKRILLFKGDSGSGKSSLLTACLNDHKSAKPVAIQLRENKVGVEGILSRSASAIGRDNLPRYTQCVQDMAMQKQQISVSNVTQKGEANSLTVTLNEKNQLAANEQRHMSLTEAWFEDVKVLGTPLVLAFDSYEQAGSEVQNWIDGTFLFRAAFCDSVRIAIAGQHVPEPGIESWRDCSDLHELYGVKDAKEWLPVVAALGKTIPFQNAETFLEIICKAFDGRPSEIMQVIETLPNATSLMSEVVSQ